LADQNDGVVARFLAVGCWNDLALPPHGSSRGRALHAAAISVFGQHGSVGGSTAATGTVPPSLRAWPAVEAAAAASVGAAAGTAAGTGAAVAPHSAVQVIPATASKRPRIALDDGAVARFLAVGCWNDLELPPHGPNRDRALHAAFQTLGLGFGSEPGEKRGGEGRGTFAETSSNCIASAFVEAGSKP
jgi:hypothetical protein